MVDNTVNISLVACQGLNACLGLVIPHLDCLKIINKKLKYKIITSCNDVGLVVSRIEINAVNTLAMACHGVVAMTVIDRPELHVIVEKNTVYFDRTI